MRGHKEQKVLRTWKTKFFRAFQHKQYGLARVLLASFLGLFIVTLAIALLFSSYTGRNYLRYSSVSAFLANPETDAEFTVNIGRTSEPYPRPLIPGLGMPNSAWSGGSQGMGGSSIASSGPEAGTQTLGMDCYLYNDKNACYQLCKDPSTIPTDKDIYCGKYDELAGVPPKNVSSLCLDDENIDACNTVCQDVKGFSAEERKKACDQFYNITGCGFDQGKVVCDGDCRNVSGGGRECWLEGQWTASLVIDSTDYQTNSNLDNAQASKVSEQQNTDCIGRLIDQKGYGEGCSSEPVTPRESPTTPSNPQPPQLPDEEKSILKSLMDSVQAGTAAVVEAAKKAVGTVAETVSSLFQGNEPKPIPITIPKTDPAPPKVSDEQRADELLHQCRNANDTAACNQLCLNYESSSACDSLTIEERNLYAKCVDGSASDCQFYCNRYPNAKICFDFDYKEGIFSPDPASSEIDTPPSSKDKCSGFTNKLKCVVSNVAGNISRGLDSVKNASSTPLNKQPAQSMLERFQNQCATEFPSEASTCSAINDAGNGAVILDILSQRRACLDSNLNMCGDFNQLCQANPNVPVCQFQNDSETSRLLQKNIQELSQMQNLGLTPSKVTPSGQQVTFKSNK